jgi:hypothetical protein
MMVGPDQKNVVFRVQLSKSRSETRLSACDLSTKRWFQNRPRTWTENREMLKAFGIAEGTLAMTDGVLGKVTRDAQYPAVQISLKTLEEAGFSPIVW